MFFVTNLSSMDPYLCLFSGDTTKVSQLKDISMSIKYVLLLDNLSQVST